MICIPAQDELDFSLLDFHSASGRAESICSGS